MCTSVRDTFEFIYYLWRWKCMLQSAIVPILKPGLKVILFSFCSNKVLEVTCPEYFPQNLLLHVSCPSKNNCSFQLTLPLHESSSTWHVCWILLPTKLSNLVFLSTFYAGPHCSTSYHYHWSCRIISTLVSCPVYQKIGLKLFSSFFLVGCYSGWLV